MGDKVIWNINDASSSATIGSDGLTLSTGNKIGYITRATKGCTTGKRYFEIYISAGGVGIVGIATRSVSLNANSITNSGIRGIFTSTGRISSTTSTSGDTWSGANNLKSIVGDTLGFLVDLDLGTISIRKNNSTIGVAFTDITKGVEWFPFASSGSVNSSSFLQLKASFNKENFMYNIPTGYVEWGHKDPTNKTLVLSENEYKTYNSGWQTVSSTTPSESQYLSDGIDDLSVLERKVQSLPPIKFNQSEILLNNGKLFAKTLDLNNYMDIRSINAEVE